MKWHDFTMKRILLLATRVLVFLALTFSFERAYSTNLLGLHGPFTTFDEFDKTSEVMMIMMMILNHRDGPDSTGGFMVELNENLDPKSLYLSSYALQGQVFSSLTRAANGHVMKVIEIGYFSVALLTALIMSLFVFWSARMFGWGPALALVIGLHLSVWTVFSARSFYNLMVLKQLPFLVAFMVYPLTLNRPAWRFRALLGLVFGLTLLTSLCQYDYITNTVLATAVGPLCFGVMRGIPRRKFCRDATWLIVAGGLAVVVALLLHTVKLAQWFGSFAEAVEFIIGRAEARAYGTDVLRSAPESTSLLHVWGGYLPLPLIAMPYANPVQWSNYTVLFSFVVLTAAYGVLAAMSLADGTLLPAFAARRGVLTGLAIATGWGLLASMSWGFVMKGHHVHHYHLNCMMFSIPFLPMLFLLAGATAETAVRQIMVSWRGRKGG